MVQGVAVTSAHASSLAGHGSPPSHSGPRVWRSAARLKTQSPVMQDALRANRVKVIAARYDLDDGTVDWFEDV